MTKLIILIIELNNRILFKKGSRLAITKDIPRTYDIKITELNIINKYNFFLIITYINT